MSKPATTQLRQPGVLVYACGIATASLAIWIVNFMHDHGAGPMGWYVKGLLPVGALMVGLLSGLGYAVGSYFLNVKLGRAFVACTALTSAADYAALQYLSYSHQMERFHANPERYTFADWWRDTTENMTFTRRRSTPLHDRPPEPLGKNGYWFRALELLGFVGGSLLPCATLISFPYCKRYLKTHSKHVISAPSTVKEWSRHPRKQRDQALKNALVPLLAHHELLLPALETLPLTQTKEFLQSVAQRRPAKDTIGFISYRLKKCPTCDAHQIDVALNNTTRDGNSKLTLLGALKKPALPAIGGHSPVTFPPPDEPGTAA